MDDLNLKTENAEFGQYLRSVRQAKKISVILKRVIINLPKESCWIE